MGCAGSTCNTAAACSIALSALLAFDSHRTCYCFPAGSFATDVDANPCTEWLALSGWQMVLSLSDGTSVDFTRVV